MRLRATLWVGGVPSAVLQARMNLLSNVFAGGMAALRAQPVLLTNTQNARQMFREWALCGAPPPAQFAPGFVRACVMTSRDRIPVPTTHPDFRSAIARREK